METIPATHAVEIVGAIRALRRVVMSARYNGADVIDVDARLTGLVINEIRAAVPLDQWGNTPLSAAEIDVITSSVVAIADYSRRGSIASDWLDADGRKVLDADGGVVAFANLVGAVLGAARVLGLRLEAAAASATRPAPRPPVYGPQDETDTDHVF